MLSSPHLTAWRQTGAKEAAEETLILNLSPCHYRPVWPPIRGLWVMWETLGPVLPTPVGQAACLVQTKLKTTGQAQLGLTSMRRRSLYAHFVVRRKEAWILISRPSLLICMLPLSPSYHAKLYFWVLYTIRGQIKQRQRAHILIAVAIAAAVGGSILSNPDTVGSKWEDVKYLDWAQFWVAAAA